MIFLTHSLLGQNRNSNQSEFYNTTRLGNALWEIETKLRPTKTYKECINSILDSYRQKNYPHCGTGEADNRWMEMKRGYKTKVDTKENYFFDHLNRIYRTSVTIVDYDSNRHQPKRKNDSLIGMPIDIAFYHANNFIVSYLKKDDYNSKTTETGENYLPFNFLDSDSTVIVYLFKNNLDSGVNSDFKFVFDRGGKVLLSTERLNKIRQVRYSCCNDDFHIIYDSCDKKIAASDIYRYYLFSKNHKYSKLIIQGKKFKQIFSSSEIESGVLSNKNRRKFKHS